MRTRVVCQYEFDTGKRDATVRLACVASVSARVRRERRDDSKKKKVSFPSPFPVIPFFFCCRPDSNY